MLPHLPIRRADLPEGVSWGCLLAGRMASLELICCKTARFSVVLSPTDGQAADGRARLGAVAQGSPTADLAP